MLLFKNILKKTGKFILFILLLTFIGIVFGISLYYFAEYTAKDRKQQSIAACIEKGINEEICKIRAY